jgi:predicted PurR-regulated permease PerM
MTSDTAPRARLMGVFVLILVGLWILHDFLVPLTWAVILALATWPLLVGIGRISEGSKPPFIPALALTLAIGGILLGPLTYGLLQLAQEAQSFALVLKEAQHNGLPAPRWLENLPKIGGWAGSAWQEWLGSSDAVRESVRHILGSGALDYTRTFAAQLFHRLILAFFTILALFFVYRDGERIGRRVLLLCDRFFGEEGSPYALHAVTAVRATVNGIVLVALGEGVALGFGYAVAGLHHATLLGALTGLVAFVPFAAKLMFVGAALVLFAEGHAAAGVGLLVYGFVVVLAAENYVRPKLIGDAVKLPFLWTLLGILGGIETFGLLGLFLGPTVMAILISIWRDCFSSEPGSENPSASRLAPSGDRAGTTGTS